MIEVKQIPWLTTDKLDASISLRNVPKVNRFITHYRARVIDWDDDVKITTWFRPKYVWITAIYTSWKTESSSKTVLKDDWTLFTTLNYNIYNYPDKTTKPASATTQVVYIYRSSTLQQQFKMRSFDEDWFTMEHTVNLWATTDLHIVAIW
jgi:hypothetical protein